MNGKDIRIRNKVKAELELSNYVTWLKDAMGVDTPYLAAKRYFIALKADVDKLDINKLVNVSSDLNNLKTKVDYLELIRLKLFL